MKGRLIVGSVLTLVVALSLTANLIVGHYVGKHLPGILSAVEGQPASLGNVRADLWRLQVSADKLTYGQSDDTAIIATNVQVGLDFRRLLRGEIYLSTASAELLKLRPALWLTEPNANETTSISAPDNSGNRAGGGPDADADIQRWMPKLLELGKIEVFQDDKRMFVGRDQRWSRTATNQLQVLWSDTHAGTVYQYQLSIDSLFDIRKTRKAEADLKVSSEGQGLLLTGTVNVELVKDRFHTKVAVKSQWLKGVWQFEAEELFELPAESRLDIAHLEPAKIQNASVLFDFAMDRDDVKEPRDILKEPLPNLQLPAHTVHTTIKQLVLDDEEIHKFAASIRLTPAAGSSGAVIAADQLSAELPRSDLTGSLSATLGESWKVTFVTEITTRQRDQSISTEYLGSDWHLQSGSGNFRTEGATLAELFVNSRGSVDLQGLYLAAEELPFTLNAKLDEQKGRVGTDVLELQIGNSSISGAVWIAEDQSSLFLRLDAKLLDLAQLRASPAAEGLDKKTTQPPGVEIPEFGWWASDMKVDAKLTGQQIDLPGLQAENVTLEFYRAKEGDKLHLMFAPHGTGTVELTGSKQRHASQQNLTLELTARDVDPATLGLDTAAARVSGSLRWQGSNSSFRGLIGNLGGPMQVQFKPETAGAVIDLQANSSLLIKGERIVGLDLDSLTLAVSDEPGATGELSLDVTIPKFSGSLQAENLDVDKLLQALPERQATHETLASTMSDLPVLDLTLKADQMRLLEKELHEFTVKLIADDGELSVSDLRFSGEIGDVHGDGKLSVKDEQIDIVLSGDLSGFELKQVLKSKDVAALAGSLDGSVNLRTSGKDWQNLSANLSGRIRLDNSAQAGNDDRMNIDVQLKQVAGGMAAEIKALQWGRSALQGQLTFLQGNPPTLTADLRSEYLDVDYLQAKLGEVPESAKMLDDASVQGTPAAAVDASGTITASSPDRSEAGIQAGAETQPDQTGRPAGVAEFGNSSLRLIRNVLATPFSLFRGDPDAGSKHFFDQAPYQLKVIKALDADVKLQLKQISGKFGNAREVAAEASLKGGTFTLQVSAEEINSAPFALNFRYDTAQVPPQATLNSTLRGFYPGANRARAPRSAFFDLRSQGSSQAQLMAGMNGEVYLQGDKGEADIEVFGLGFFTGDLLSRVTGLLLPNPGATPILDCGLAYGTITDGVLLTPYGIVLQSPRANILIRATVDMKKETIAAQFDSRNRKGAGVSVGNVFSNTVRLSGPLINPGLVPNTMGLAWRSWAALMTGGMSLLGESFAKRLLGSRDPCKHLTDQIQEKVCKPGLTPAASSPLVCGAG